MAALGTASLGFALANRDYAEPTNSAGWTNYAPLADERCVTCGEPLPWLVTGVVLVVVAVVPFLLAARQR